MLHDRQDESRLLSGLLDAVRAGRSRSLVVCGEAGVGKTALLDHFVGHATDCRVASVAGVEAEQELAFAGLHQICRPFLDRLDVLPEPQRNALSTAFGLRSGPPPDPFLISLGTLSLLAEASTRQPLVCIVDDAQWFDTASLQALTFAARRMVAERIAMVFAARDCAGSKDFDGIPELVLEGLGDDAARELLRSVLAGPVDPQVLDQILAESRGIPLALIEAPRTLDPAQLAGGFGLPGSQQLVPSSVEETYVRALDELPADTRRLLAIAAAEPLGDPLLTWRAAETLGIGLPAAGPAEASGLVRLGTRFQFRHSLVRSAVYRSATPQELRQAHAALATVTDPVTDPDRRAWHRAQSVNNPDEDVASELEESAARAQSRGGLIAAAAFMSRAVELSGEASRRTERAIAAARAYHQAGHPEDALRLLPVAEAGRLDDRTRAEVDLLRAQIAFTVNRGADAPPLLLRAARELETIDPPLARETYLDAVFAAMFADDCSSSKSLGEVVEAARNAVRPSSPGATDLLLDGLAVRFTEGYAAAVPLLTEALAAFRGLELTTESMRWFWLAHIVAGNLWNEQTLDNQRHLDVARELGAMATLPLALSVRMGAHVVTGELQQAAGLQTELDAVNEVTGLPMAPYGALLLAAWQGQEQRARALIAQAEVEAKRRGESFGLILTGMAAAILNNSLGRYDEAFTEATRAAQRPPVMGVEPWAVLAELTEAAVRLGRRTEAEVACERLAETTQATRTAWGLGVEARCRAQLASDDEAEVQYRTAIEHLSQTRIHGELARSHLMYGEWLRRANRVTEARAELRTAYEQFDRMGMQAFAERSAGELRAAGDSVPANPGPEAPDLLTAQEAQIARLVADGLSNAEIAARLFLSPRTVEWHLGKVFAKLQLTSRRQLRHQQLPGSG